MGGVPSVPQGRSRALKVVGAGYFRTGTFSIALALERLLDEAGDTCSTYQKAAVSLHAQPRHLRPRTFRV